MSRRKGEPCPTSRPGPTGLCMPGKKTLLRLSLGMVALVALLAPSAASAGTSCPNANVLAGGNVSTYNDSILCLLNEQRTQHGLAPLVSNAGLASSALAHSAEMRANRYFAHDSSDGSSFSDRIAATGYLRGARNWLVGENIAWGSLTLGTPQALTIAWMNSPEHRENILEPGFKEIGVGTVWGTPSNPSILSAAIVTTDFGVKATRKAKKSKKAKKARKAAKRRLHRLHHSR